MARMFKDKAGAPETTARHSLITAWHKSGSKLSLKRWAREQKDDSPGLGTVYDGNKRRQDDRSLVARVRAWTSNKRTKFGAPPEGIGRTRLSKKGNKGGGTQSGK